MEAISPEKSGIASPERDVLVDHDVGRAGDGEFAPCSGAHVGAAAEAIGERDDLGVAPLKAEGQNSQR